jgi:hypothetical protein
MVVAGSLAVDAALILLVTPAGLSWSAGVLAAGSAAILGGAALLAAGARRRGEHP